MKIRELTISARAKMCLLSAGYEELEELTNVTDDDLLKIKNLNEKGVAEIRGAINKFLVVENMSEDCIASGLDNKSSNRVKKQYIYFVLDCGNDISAMTINAYVPLVYNYIYKAMCDFEKKIDKEKRTQAEIVCNVMNVSEKALWLQKNIPLSEIKWEIQKSTGVTKIEEGFHLLYSDLKNEFEATDCNPYIIFILSGDTENKISKSMVEQFSKIPWGKNSYKKAFIIERKAVNKNVDLLMNQVTKFSNDELIKEVQILPVALSFIYAEAQSVFNRFVGNNKLKKIMNDYQEIEIDSLQFRKLIDNYYYREKIERNLILASIDKGIAHEIKNTTTVSLETYDNYVTQLQTVPGIEMEFIDKILICWIDAFMVNKDPMLREQLCERCGKYLEQGRV